MLLGAAALAPVLVIVAAPPSAQVAERPRAWTSVALAGGRGALLPPLGLDARVPRALALVEAIRVVHGGAPDTTDPRLAFALEQAAAAAADRDETIPLPLTPDVWREFLLKRPADDRQLAAAILQDRHAALAYVGLAGLDDTTLRWLAQRPRWLQGLNPRRAAVLAAFAPSIAVADGALRVPGGAAALPAWTELAGVPPSSPESFIEALLDRDEGRLAYFYDTIEALSPEGRRWALSLDVEEPGERTRRTKALYRVFAEFERGWDVSRHPFQRMPYDPATFCALVAIDREGRLTGPRSRTFWARAFDNGTVDGSFQPGPEVEPADLVALVAAQALPVRQRRWTAVFFAQRVYAAMPHGSAAALTGVRGALRYPALLLALERIGVVSPEQHALAARRVEYLMNVGDVNRLERGVTLFQSALALVDRARAAGAIDERATTALVDRLFARAAPASGRERLYVGTWIRQDLLPALGAADARNPGADDSEHVLIEALAGLRASAAIQARGAAPIRWEDNAYRVDVAGAELERLRRVRTEQGGNSLDDALAFTDVATGAEAATTASDWLPLVQAAQALHDRLQPLDAVEDPAVGRPPDVLAPLTRLREARDRHGRVDPGRARQLQSSLEEAAAAVLADVLASIVYACALGDSGSQAFLADNVARRHDLGLRSAAGRDRRALAWTLAVEASGPGRPWHVEGALLGLDLALARRTLRPTSTAMPQDAPTVPAGEQQTLVQGLAFIDPLVASDAEARTVVEALRAGRTRVLGATPADAGSLARDAQVGGWRRALLPWMLAEGQRDTGLFSAVEVARVGGAPGLAAALARWGPAQTALTGCWCAAVPFLPPERLTGRPGSGQLTTGLADLTLRVVEGLVDLHLPAALARDTLRVVMGDFLGEVRVGHPDDWLGIALQARSLTTERLTDSVATLTADGPLIPPADASQRSFER